MAWLNKIIARSKFLKEFYNRYEDYKVYLVDGEQIRNISPDLNYFANFAIYVDIKDIPEDEIWIDGNLDEIEKFFAVATAVYELNKIKSEGPKKAHISALNYNKKIREIVDNVKHKPEDTNEPPPKEVYLGKYGVINSEKIIVWIVDGRIVRDLFHCDFQDGGSDFSYKWIPNNEIWIENVIREKEIPCIILHEVVERFLMKHKQYSYTKAHDIASSVEFRARNKNISKENILNINLTHLIKGEKL